MLVKVMLCAGQTQKVIAIYFLDVHIQRVYDTENETEIFISTGFISQFVEILEEKKQEKMEGNKWGPIICDGLLGEYGMNEMQEYSCINQDQYTESCNSSFRLL